MQGVQGVIFYFLFFYILYILFIRFREAVRLEFFSSACTYMFTKSPSWYLNKQLSSRKYAESDKGSVLHMQRGPAILAMRNN